MDGLTFLLVCMLGAVGAGAAHTLLDGVVEWWRLRHP